MLGNNTPQLYLYSNRPVGAADIAIGAGGLGFDSLLDQIEYSFAKRLTAAAILLRS